MQLGKRAGFGCLGTDRVLDDAAAVNLAEIFGCIWTNLVNVRQQSHLVDSWEDDSERFERFWRVPVL